MFLDQQVMHIWPNGDLLDFPEITLSPESGMKGYPTFTTTGIEVCCEWHPALLFDNKVNVASSVPMASGTWQVQRANHGPWTLTPDRTWFGILNLSPLSYLSVNPD
ncbi:hypothetical protein BDI4_210048 [Burkholderia diffusa]|uniref:hypothetical protein n=1 Tax=Burkholderia diffusa TaxID=488732 RepID=UPI001CAC603B|nr:hypothetical protein [Burkholderia diffusa]CAG9247757.1 hypothetical protein BDI4_210048 [Burkholderia diffusa]